MCAWISLSLTLVSTRRLGPSSNRAGPLLVTVDRCSGKSHTDNLGRRTPVEAREVGKIGNPLWLPRHGVWGGGAGYISVNGIRDHNAGTSGDAEGHRHIKR